MATTREPSDKRQQLQRALLALQKTRTRLEVLEQTRSEPIAVIGLGCRFPGGADDPEKFWQLLQAGVDAIREAPPERWDTDLYYDADPAAPGKMYTRSGGFLEQVDQFDPQFFGIAPREARSLDPQQRLLLEVTWEALERAAIAPDSLSGAQTGVFIGISGMDYSELLVGGNLDAIDLYAGSGNAHSVAAGRLSYVLGLQGPCLAVDTACSSSLVTLHLACQSLRAGECDLALTGGVNLLLSPTVSVNHSRAQMLAPDGRCKTFAASADGFSRADGCGMIVLKRLSDALADGDSILALVRGSAVNHDGRTSGLTVPNGPAQQAVIRSALQSARLEPAQISYVEAHGTGTALGDPIEMGALGAVFGPQRPTDSPLMVGSVKTNIGHAEAAAGIAGVIKTILALQHAEIPPHLHFTEPNPLIQWDALPAKVPVRRTPWLIGLLPRRAGVSSFGFGGTNAHVILEEAPPAVDTATQPAKATQPLHLLALSARSAPALHELADRYARRLAANPALPIEAVCHTANNGRAHFDHRLTIVAPTTPKATQQLADFAAGQLASGVRQRQAPATAPKVAFLFSGQGSQYIGMGQELYKTQPTFRAALKRCAEFLHPHLDIPLLEILHPESPITNTQYPITNTQYTQPALFALEYALAQLWQSWGVEPSAVLGHSVGELVAACVAGVFSLEDGLALVAARGRLMGALPVGGVMAAVFANEARVATVIAQATAGVSIAALNAPQQVTISGALDSVEAAIVAFHSEGIACQRLQVSHAFHSPLMEPILAEFGQITGGVEFALPQIDFVSNLTGQLANAEITAPQYWQRHVRQPVQFEAGLRALQQQGVDVFVEIGPQPTLLGLGRQCLPDVESDRWLASLRKGRSDWETLLASLAAMYTHGVSVNWTGVESEPASERQRVVLPTYPFQRRSYWAPAATQPPSSASDPGRVASGGLHPLLGQRVYSAASPDDILFQAQIGPQAPAYLAHHRVFENVLLPAAVYYELALAAGRVIFNSASMELKEVAIQQPLALPETERQTIQVVLTPAAPDVAGFRIFSLDQNDHDEPSWRLHASGMVRTAQTDAAPHVNLSALQAEITTALPVADFYDQYLARGLDFGRDFRAVAQIWHNDTAALAQLQLPETQALTLDDYCIHPTLLDAGAQILGAVFAGRSSAETYLQVGIERLHLYGQPPARMWAYARLRTGSASSQVADVQLLDAAGSVVVEITGQSSRPANTVRVFANDRAALHNQLYEIQWRALPPTPMRSPADYFPDGDTLRMRLLPWLAEQLSTQEMIRYSKVLDELQKLGVPIIVHALQQLGCDIQSGRRFTDADLAGLGVAPQRQRLFERLLQILAEAKVIRRNGAAWDAVLRPEIQDSAQSSADLLARFPEAHAEITLLERCGAGLTAVLRGERDPLELIFPAGDVSEVTHIYQDSPGARVMNTLLQQTVYSLLSALPSGRPLRILEIGAGTGSTTSYLLPQLPAAQTEYVFTDISPRFTIQAQQKFNSYPFVRYQVFDVEQAPAAQGLPSGQFDLIVAANVLHATRDLRQSLEHIQQLLAPGGMLLLLESTAAASWVDLIFGLTEGWWRFSDSDIRSTHPLISANRWEALLTAGGYEQAVSIAPDKAQYPALAQQALLVARRPPAAAAGRWLIFTDESGVGQHLATLLQAKDQVCTLVTPGATLEQVSAQTWRLNPDSAADFRELLVKMADDSRALRGVAHLWSLDAAPAGRLTSDALLAAARRGVGSALYLVQALAAAGFDPAPTLWLATRQAQPVDGQPLDGLAQSPLWGLGKNIALEHPMLWGGLVDLAAGAPEDVATALLAELLNPDGEQQIALRGGQRFGARLVHTQAGGQLPVRSDGAYLITGGLGAFGLAAARWLAAEGAQQLVLVGRSGAQTALGRTAIADLEGAGVQVLVVQADVSDADQLAAVFAELDLGPPLRGVIHAAGLPGGYRELAALDFENLAEQFAAKVVGAWQLHQLTKDKRLDFFVCCSSMVALWGARGQANYVAANQFLDVLAHYRRAQGLPALSVNWGPLTGGGMLPPEILTELARMGVATFELHQAMAALGTFLGAEASQIAVVDIDWQRFKGVYEARGRRAFFAEIATPASDSNASAKSTAEHPAPILECLHNAPESERSDLLTAHVRTEVAQVLGLEEAELLAAQQGFFDMGMDSLTAMELKTRLEAALGKTLPATLVFDYTTVAALTTYLLQQTLAPNLSAPPPAQPEPDGMPTTAAMLAELSDAEVETLLLEKLEDNTPS